MEHWRRNFKDHELFKSFRTVCDYFDEVRKSGKLWQQEFNQGPSYWEQEWIRLAIRKGARCYESNHHTYLCFNIPNELTKCMEDVTEFYERK